uniref:F-box protein AT5G49610-like beta-propeller domain-containing protein n=1 Tax=Arundo donax TaxID=35708 RepID=A0A0A9CH62_ARUDO
MSGDRCRIPFSAEIEVSTFITAALVAAAGVVDCASFRLVALFTDDAGTNVSASVYSSDSSVWVDSVATLVLPSPTVFIHYPSTLVGNAVYWLLDGVILQFDLETQSLVIIEKPPDANVGDAFRCQIMPAEDGRFGLAVLAEASILFWKRETYLSSGAKWVLCRTVQLDRLLSLGKKGLKHPLGIMGISEEDNVIFVGTYLGVFMIHLELMQFRKVFEQTAINYIFPYSSF